MELNVSLAWFIALVMSVGTLRLIELSVSRRRRAALIARGATVVPEPHFRSMVALHAAILLACPIEAWLRARPPALIVSIAMLAVLLCANLLRFWVIASLGEHWNAQIMASLPLGVITRGPFRWIRHPNYVAVFVELMALPLVYGAWITAFVGAAIHVWVLSQRIRSEETMLMSDAEYRARMGKKPRFIPGLL